MDKRNKIFWSLIIAIVAILALSIVLGSNMGSELEKRTEKGLKLKEEKEVYRDSIDEAIEYGVYSVDDEMDVPDNIDYEIKKFETEDYVLLFYYCIYSEEKGGFYAITIEKEGTIPEKYRVDYYVGYDFYNNNNTRLGTHEDVVHSFIRRSQVSPKLNIFGEDCCFVWGISESDKINSLKIEGQSPTEIIPCGILGVQDYFWYYEDLQTDKPYDEWEVKLDE